MFEFEKLQPATYEELIEKFELTVPENFNFAFDVVDAKAEKNGRELAMIHVDDNDVRREYDFDFFARQSARLANALQKQGLGKGDKVMLILHRRVEFWVSMLALKKVGAISIPSPALLTKKDIVYRVNFADIRGIIADEGVVGQVEEALPECPDLNILIQAGEQDVKGWKNYGQITSSASDKFERSSDSMGGDDPCLIYFSSGTTGQPKMVAHSHTYPLGHFTTAVYWHDLVPGDIHLTVSDTGWGKAVWGKFYGQWIAGAVIFVYDFRGKFDPDKLLQVVAEHKITTFCAPPTVYRFLIRQDLKKYDFSHLRHCTTAGELLNDNVFHTWKKQLGLPIFEGYGQTETTLQIATFPFMEAKPGSIGKPSPGWKIDLLDENGNICPPGVEGEICVSLENGGPVGLFSTYLKEEEKTASVKYAGYYHTGDKAWQDEDGYLWFLGRVDDLIKSSGYRIGPFEVESALVAHDAVVEAAVTGVPDEVRGQAVKATVTLGPGYEPSDELTKELQEYVKKTTAPYKYPRIIEYVDELPKTISGKIKRGEIRSQDMEKYK